MPAPSTDAISAAGTCFKTVTNPSWGIRSLRGRSTEFRDSYPGAFYHVTARGNAVEEKVGADAASPLLDAIGVVVLGRPAFVEKIAAQHVDRGGPQREVPAPRQLISRRAPDPIRRAVEATFAGNEKMARRAGMYLGHRYSGEKVREIGALYGVGPAAITAASRNFANRMAKDQELTGMVGKLKAEPGI